MSYSHIVLKGGWDSMNNFEVGEVFTINSISFLLQNSKFHVKRQNFSQNVAFLFFVWQLISYQDKDFSLNSLLSKIIFLCFYHKIVLFHFLIVQFQFHFLAAEEREGSAVDHRSLTWPSCSRTGASGTRTSSGATLLTEVIVHLSICHLSIFHLSIYHLSTCSFLVVFVEFWFFLFRRCAIETKQSFYARTVTLLPSLIWLDRDSNSCPFAINSSHRIPYYFISYLKSSCL